MKFETRNYKKKLLKKSVFIFLTAIFVLQTGAVGFALATDDKDKESGFVLNLSYPNIPGLGRLSDYKNLPEPQRIGFMVSYVFKLFFFVAVGLALTALLASGVLYIVSLSKPRWIILAKQMASNAMLGIFILLCAALLLYAINPQLLSLTLVTPQPKNVPVDLTANPYDKGTISAEEMPVSRILKESVKNSQEKVMLITDGANKNSYCEKIKTSQGEKECFTDGYGGLVNKEGKYLNALSENSPDRKTAQESGCIVRPNGTVATAIYRAQILPIEAANITGQVLEIIKDKKDAAGKITSYGLNSLLANCQCGSAKNYVGGGKCQTGLEGMPHTIAKNKAEGNTCLNQCGSCGEEKKNNQLLCDLRDVRKNKETGNLEVCQKNSSNGTCDPDKVDSKGKIIKDPCWRSFTEKDSYLTAIGGDVCSGGGLAVVVGNLIKYKTLRLQELRVKMESRQRSFANFAESTDLISKALDSNRADFVIGQAKGLWGFDASNQYEQWQSQGYKVVVNEYRGADQSPTEGIASIQKKSPIMALLSRMKSLVAPFITAAETQIQYVGFEPGAFYMVTYAPSGVQDEEITKLNQKISRDAQRFNLFSLLTDLPLEGMENVFKDCLTYAFGAADYLLDKSQIEKILKSVKESGAADHLMAVIRQKLDEITRAIADGLNKGIVDDATLAFTQKFFDKCVQAKECLSSKVKKIAYQISVLGGKENRVSALDNTCLYCVKNLMDNGIPPRFVSNTIAGFFTKGIDEAFPGIKTKLETNTQDVLFPSNQTIGTFLDKDMASVYDSIFQGALLTPFDEVPALDSLLNKQVSSMLPSFIYDQIDGINKWFVGTVSFSKSKAKEYSERFSTDLANELVAQPMHEWAQKKFDQMGLGIEHLTISACFEKLQEGYEYVVTQSVIDIFNAGDKPADLERRKNSEPGHCEKMSPDQINALNLNGVPRGFFWNAKFQIDTGQGNGPIKGVDYFTAAFSFKESICKNAGYAWDCGVTIRNATKADEFSFDMSEIKPKTDSCECWEKDDLAQDLKNIYNTANDAKKLKQTVKVAVINYVEKLATAFAETAMRAALAYARVFVEDNFIAPFLTSWNQITNFQSGMQKFMTVSVKEILPSQIKDILHNNLEQEIDRFCDAYEKAREDVEKNPDKKCTRDTVSGGVPIVLSYNLPTGVTRENKDVFTSDLCVSQKTGDKICQFKGHLDQKVLQEIIYYSCNTRYADGSVWQDKCNKFFTELKLPLEEALGHVCFTVDEKEICLETASWFGRSLASMLWPQIDNLDNLIEATPKQLICGENLTAGIVDGKTKIALLTDSKQESINKTCKQIFLPNMFGIIPVFEKDFKLTQLQKDLKPWCAFIYTGCQIPIPTIDTTAGKLIETIVTTGCSVYKTDESEKTCNVLVKNSIFYSLLYETVKNETNEEDTIKFYVDMWNYFPGQLADIQAVVKNLQDKQNIAWEEVEAQKAKGGFGLSSLVGLLAQNRASLTSPTIRELLNQNKILNQTPYQVIKDSVCPGIVNGFEAANEKYGFDSVEAECLDKIRSAGLYTMESTGSCTLAEKVAIISGSNAPGADEYIFCKILEDNITPQEIAGLDLPLRNYIQPKEFIIMFDMLDQELSPGGPQDCNPDPEAGEVFSQEGGQAKCCDATGLCYKVGERPAGLNQLLDFMANQNPIAALEGLQQTMPDGSLSFAFYVNNVEGCLKVDSAISSCKTPIPAIFQANNIDTSAVITSTAKPAGILFDNVKVFPFGSVQGYALYQDTGSNLVLAFKEPNNQAKANFGEILNFMQTPIGDIIEPGLGTATAVDMICGDAGSWCDEAIDKAWAANIKTITEILGSTPVELAAKYLTKPVNIKQPQASVMDALSANTALGQPMVDTLFRVIGAEGLFAEGVSWGTKQTQWIDSSVVKGIEAMQNALETALVDWPREAALKLAELVGLNLGEGFATDIAGAPCHEIPKEGCDKAKEVQRTVAGKQECCVLAKAQACQPRCRLIDNNTAGCNVLAGESSQIETKIIDDRAYNFCCFAKVEGKDATGKTIAQCQKCRQVDFTAGANCRVQDETGIREKDNPYEKAIGNACCFNEEFSLSSNVAIPDTVDEYIQNNGMCCSTVSQCIANGLSSHIEGVAEMMADGFIPLRSLRER